MNNNYYAVIMAGGIGSRFWPVSTGKFPKQFHDMLGTGESLLQRTFNRLVGIVPVENIRILTNERYLGLCLDQLPDISANQVVLEPAMRNTAPCILLSALKIKKENPDAMMLVAPSDHWIEDELAFRADVELCFEECKDNDKLITLGIHPSFPNTGYGYIESDVQTDESIQKVIQFTEKPDYETAKEFVSSGNFFWNAGIFLWSVNSICIAFEKLMPELSALFSEGIPKFNTSDEKSFVDANYQKAENISIDYGILEKAENVYVKKASFDWNDLGTWGALHDKLPKDPDGNAVVNAITHLKDTNGNMIFSVNDRLVVIEGLKEYIVVDHDKVLLIFPKEKEQQIKELLAEVEKEFGTKYT
ncbi:MAG: mannose-1-phosphate guanylyltransferase [Flavobacteriaceae bacterium]|nr:mannose-1-phosphate guanylyltransferase [Flavobacteriaceae bacterium]